MNRDVRKRHVLLSFTLSAAVCLAAGIVPVFAANTSGTDSFSVEDAKAAAAEYLPDGSSFLRSDTDDREYELKYYNEDLNELYEIEVNRSSGKVTKLESQKTNRQDSREVKLSVSDVEKLVSEEYEEVQRLSVVLDRDDGYYVYDVTLISEDQKIELEIQPVSGEILEREIHYGYTAPDTLTQGSSVIGYEKARSLAEELVPDAIITDMELDRENGSLVYEIELYKDGYEYELVLNALTGEKVYLNNHQDYWTGDGYSYKWNHHGSSYSGHHEEKHHNSSRSDSSSTSNTSVLSAEQVRDILLEKVPGAAIKELELDTDDGRLIYEGELRKGKMEYEFAMDAVTGVFLEWEAEYDD